jgi:hypothetical protein
MEYPGAAGGSRLAGDERLQAPSTHLGARTTCDARVGEEGLDKKIRKVGKD